VVLTFNRKTNRRLDSLFLLTLHDTLNSTEVTHENHFLHPVALTPLLHFVIGPRLACKVYSPVSICSNKWCICPATEDQWLFKYKCLNSVFLSWILSAVSSWIEHCITWIKYVGVKLILAHMWFILLQSIFHKSISWLLCPYQDFLCPSW